MQRAEQRSGVARVLSHSAAGGLGYALAQGVNFLVQLALVYHLGKDGFSSIGLAQMCVVAVMFAAELGTGSYFIREASQRTDWQQEWRRASVVRSGVAGLFAAALLGGWLLYYPGDRQGFHYLLAALPAMLLSVRNPTPLLIAQGKAWAAGLGLVLQWCSYAVFVAFAVGLLPEAQLGHGIGAAYTAGYVLALLFLSRRVTWHQSDAPVDPAAYRRMAKSSAMICVLALCGTAYGLMLTFIAKHLAPEVLVYFILGSQVMQGMSGLNLQLQRVLLAALASRHGLAVDSLALLGPVYRFCSGLMMAVMLGIFGALLLAAHWMQDAALLGDMPVLCLLMAEGLLGMLGAFLSTGFLASHREPLLFRVMLRFYVLGMVGQLLLAVWTGDLVMIQLMRIALAAAQMLILYRLLGQKLAKLPWIGVGILLALAALPYGAIAPLMLGSGAMLMGAVLLLSAGLQYRRAQALPVLVQAAV